MSGCQMNAPRYVLSKLSDPGDQIIVTRTNRVQLVDVVCKVLKSLAVTAQQAPWHLRL